MKNKYLLKTINMTSKYDEPIRNYRDWLPVYKLNEMTRDLYKKIPFIIDSQWWWHKEDIKDFYLDKIQEINTQNIYKYNWWMKYRFFYWIYDYKNNKGWFMFHWLKKEEFFIEIWLKEAWFYDCKFPNRNFVCTDFSRRLLREDVKEKIIFDNDIDNYLYDLNTLYYFLLWFWARWPFIKHIIPTAWIDWIARREHSILFYNQYKLLKDTLKDDELIKLREKELSNKKSLDRDYFNKFWCLPVENYKIRYNKMVKYLWIENRVIYNISSKNLKDELINIKNFEERKKLIYDKFKELYPNEVINE